MKGYYITKDFVNGGCLHYISYFLFDEPSQLLYKCVSHRRSDAFIFKDYSFALSALDLLNGLSDNYRKGFDVHGNEIEFHFEYKLHRSRS